MRRIDDRDAVDVAISMLVVLAVWACVLGACSSDGLPEDPRETRGEQCYRLSLDERGFSDPVAVTRCLYGSATSGSDGGVGGVD